MLKKRRRKTDFIFGFKGDGIRYTFRSVNKNPIKALDYNLRNTIVADIVKDQTTTQQPYGALAADILLNKLGIIHAHPKLFIMPDNPKLGKFPKMNFQICSECWKKIPKIRKKGKLDF
ncbi:MAG: hypothetical protein IPH62_20010 [Ignavibacteriae bacterium]|nr:hypothetical protein [Ignavibacteriota bacterium]